jgi:hypothetical protein
LGGDSSSLHHGSLVTLFLGTYRRKTVPLRPGDYNLHGSLVTLFLGNEQISLRRKARGHNHNPWHIFEELMFWKHPSVFLCCFRRWIMTLFRDLSHHLVLYLPQDQAPVLNPRPPRDSKLIWEPLYNLHGSKMKQDMETKVWTWIGASNLSLYSLFFWQSHNSSMSLCTPGRSFLSGSLHSYQDHMSFLPHI